MADEPTPKPCAQKMVDNPSDTISETQGSVVSIATSSDYGQSSERRSESTSDAENRSRAAGGEQGDPVQPTIYKLPRDNTTENPVGKDQITVGRLGYNETHGQSKNASRVDAIALQEKHERSQIPAPRARSLRGGLLRLKRTSIPILLCFVSFGLLATVIIYVQSTYTAESNSRRGLALSDLLKTDVSKTLTVLRTSQGILSALTSLALENIFFLLQWSQIHPPEGLSYLRILALSPTTGGLGTLRLLQSSAPNLATKLWALLRYPP